MSKKSISIILVILMCLFCGLFFVPHDRTYKVLEVITPTRIILENKEFKLSEFDSFDSTFTLHNRELAAYLGITEEEAFILGNLGKYRFENLIKGRKVYIKQDDLIYSRYSYKERFYYSGFCIKDFEPCYKDAFEYQLNNLRFSKYKVIDLNNNNVYDISDPKVKSLEKFVVIRKSQVNKPEKPPIPICPAKNIAKGVVKVYFSDFTTKLKPDRECSSDICREILSNINKSKNSIDIAIYGYSRVPVIEKALIDAQNRGVKIRLVYDEDTKGGNIYDDTSRIVQLIPDNMSDRNSELANNIMHNKFYIFDDKILITGSANLSHTDMSGFNSNSIVVINSPDVAKVYKQEFEQMYSGKFHTDKVSHQKDNHTNFGIYFSPQDKSVTNAVLPLIIQAKKYIYIPTFLLTEKRVTEELIKAKKRGVDVKIIIDSSNASGKYSKHQILRDNGVQVKTENYAGKMHSKSMIVDDEYVIIGSMNFSASGENKNDENLMVIKDSEIARLYKNFFMYQWNKIDNKWLKYNARAEGVDSIGSCTDGIDNNYDGLVDNEDSSCKVLK